MKRKIWRILFKILQKINITILPNHFYSNIPDFGILNSQDFWKKPMSMIGVNGIEIHSQLEFIKECVNSLEDKSILENFNIINLATREQNETGYGVIEADFLLCFINHFKPKKIIQIGCGISTSIILRASRIANYSINITCIEPYPSEYLKQLDEKQEIRLISKIAQNVPIDTLIDLDSGDLLFIDSTHTVKTGSEVNRIILEVIPRLKKNVFIHFHDIYFPFDYQRNFKSTLFFWNESTLLHSLLINNNNLTIRASQSMLHYEAKDVLQEIFSNYKPQSENYGLPTNRNRQYHFPSSTFLQVI